ncbi:hypothetical protein D3C76_1740860 [compost metagenome]
MFALSSSDIPAIIANPFSLNSFVLAGFLPATFSPSTFSPATSAGTAPSTIGASFFSNSSVFTAPAVFKVLSVIIHSS